MAESGGGFLLVASQRSGAGRTFAPLYKMDKENFNFYYHRTAKANPQAICDHHLKFTIPNPPKHKAPHQQGGTQSLHYSHAEHQKPDGQQAGIKGG